MRICKSHWDELRAAICDRGLGGLVSAGGRKAMSKVIAQAKGDDSNAQYDPLMSANFAIWNNSIEAFGVDVMFLEDFCPLCEVDRHARECTNPECKFKFTAEDWIRLAADGQLQAATERGLVVTQ